MPEVTLLCPFDPIANKKKNVTTPTFELKTCSSKLDRYSAFCGDMLWIHSCQIKITVSIRIELLINRGMLLYKHYKNNITKQTTGQK